MNRSTTSPSHVLRRRELLIGAGALAGGFAASPLSALANTAWPTRPVRIVVPFAPGGGADSSARVLAELFGTTLGQPFIVDNKPGAGSAIGVNHVAQSKDGHTLLMGSNSMVINSLLVPNIGYDVNKDFDVVGMVSDQPLVLVVPSNSSLQTLNDIVQQAKADPGKLTAGNSGNGTLAHLTAEMFSGEAGIEFTHVPYKGESAMMPDVLAGLVSLGFLNLPSVLPHIRAGKLRAIAVSSPKPVADLPGVPTLRSLNYPNLEMQGWAALFAPKGSIPAAGLAQLETMLSKALQSDTVKTKFASIGVAPVLKTRAQAGQFMRAELDRYAGVIKSRGIKAS
ncbi:Bug family tripartite tricarboxylate transporter substrate binding protein [Hydrogenophaga sp. BPS33]|uniref:Bug family tripartite tricarboxylate transporter substrate binding protein n=1 Tax=Hydrogenophaga sp. BPS33 TaxID=2651974 RepID=UPI00131F5A2E|nr:tripartite tricarboxylate transporter substrate binding protein [Hydrogenophaga sp. BPS33]QHE88052.1 tripartite tricarboxylate transporter substrate binding protein [Hydrogenophaga sp. BPS33]